MMDIRRGSFVLLVLAVANGGFREALLNPRCGSHTGHLVSTVMLCGGILIVTYFAVSWIHLGSRGDAIAIGLAWLVLTLAFEFGFDRARGKPWAELLADYDVLNGRAVPLQRQGRAAGQPRLLGDARVHPAVQMLAPQASLFFMGHHSLWDTTFGTAAELTASGAPYRLPS